MSTYKAVNKIRVGGSDVLNALEDIGLLFCVDHVDEAVHGADNARPAAAQPGNRERERDQWC